MNATPSSELFAASMLGSATSAGPVPHLLAELHTLTPSQLDTLNGLAVQPPVEVVEQLSKLPAGVARLVVASLDMSADSGPALARAAFGDSRKTVRRQLADVHDLPIDVAEDLLMWAGAKGDSETLESLAGQGLPASVWAAAFSAKQVSKMSGRAYNGALDAIAADYDVACAFVRESPAIGVVAALLARCTSGTPHFVDLLDVALSRGISRVPLLKAALKRMPGIEHFDLRMIEWLAENKVLPARVKEAQLGVVAKLDDPERIAAWWRSGLLTPEQMCGKDEVVPPLAARASAGVLDPAGDPGGVVAAVTAMCAFYSHKAKFDMVGHWVETALVCLELLEMAAAGGADVSEGCAKVAEVVQRVRSATADEGDVAHRFAERVAALAPAHAGQLLLSQSVAPSIAGDVVADPARFGVSPERIIKWCDRWWADSPELAGPLFVNTPGLVKVLSTDAHVAWAVRRAVFAHLDEVFGGVQDCWVPALHLAPDWDGSAAGLAAVCAAVAQD